MQGLSEESLSRRRGSVPPYSRCSVREKSSEEGENSGRHCSDGLRAAEDGPFHPNETSLDAGPSSPSAPLGEYLAPSSSASSKPLRRPRRFHGVLEAHSLRRLAATPLRRANFGLPSVSRGQPPKTTPATPLSLHSGKEGAAADAALAKKASSSAWTAFSSPSSGRIFVLTYLAYAALYCTRKPLSVVKGSMHSALGISTHTLGGLDTAFLGAYAAGQLLLPLCLSLLPPRRAGAVAACCFVASAAATMAFGAASSPLLLTLFWGLNGLAHAPVFPLLLLLLTNAINSRQRGAALGLWTTSQQVGEWNDASWPGFGLCVSSLTLGSVVQLFFAGAMLATAFAACVEAWMGWRRVFFAAGAAAAVSAPLLLCLKTGGESHLQRAPLLRTQLAEGEAVVDVAEGSGSAVSVFEVTKETELVRLGRGSRRSPSETSAAALPPPSSKPDKTEETTQEQVPPLGNSSRLSKASSEGSSSTAVPCETTAASEGGLLPSHGGKSPRSTGPGLKAKQLALAVTHEGASLGVSCDEGGPSSGVEVLAQGEEEGELRGGQGEGLFWKKCGLRPAFPFLRCGFCLTGRAKRPAYRSLTTGRRRFALCGMTTWGCGERTDGERNGRGLLAAGPALPLVLCAAAAYFFVKLIRYSLLLWLPFFLVQQANLSAASAAAASLPFDLGGVFGAVLTGLVADKLLGGRRLACAAAMSVGSGFCLLVLALVCQQQRVLNVQQIELSRQRGEAVEELRLQHEAALEHLEFEFKRSRQQLPVHLQQRLERAENLQEELEKMKQLQQQQHTSTPAPPVSSLEEFSEETLEGGDSGLVPKRLRFSGSEDGSFAAKRSATQVDTQSQGISDQKAKGAAGAEASVQSTQSSVSSEITPPSRSASSSDPSPQQQQQQKGTVSEGPSLPVKQQASEPPPQSSFPSQEASLSEEHIISKTQQPVSLDQPPAPLAQQQASPPQQQGLQLPPQSSLAQQQAPLAQQQGVQPPQQAPLAQQQGLQPPQQSSLAQQQASLTQQQAPLSQQQASLAQQQASLAQQQGLQPSQQAPVAPLQTGLPQQQVLGLQQQQVSVAAQQAPLVAPQQQAPSAQQQGLQPPQQAPLAQQQASLAQQQASLAQQQASLAQQQASLAQQQLTMPQTTQISLTGKQGALSEPQFVSPAQQGSLVAATQGAGPPSQTSISIPQPQPNQISSPQQQWPASPVVPVSPPPLQIQQTSQPLQQQQWQPGLDQKPAPQQANPLVGTAQQSPPRKLHASGLGQRNENPSLKGAQPQTPPAASASPSPRLRSFSKPPFSASFPVEPPSLEAEAQTAEDSNSLPSSRRSFAGRATEAVANAASTQASFSEDFSEQRRRVASLDRGEVVNEEEAPPSRDSASAEESDGGDWALTLLRLEVQEKEKQEALLKEYEAQRVELGFAYERQQRALSKAEAFQVRLLLLCMLLVGFFVAAPDSILGASAGEDLIDVCKAPPGAAPAVAAFINALGAVGALLQGVCTAAVSEAYGWDALFGLLCLFAICSGILLLPAAVTEGRRRRAED